MRNEPLIIWVNSPPFVESGAFAHLENNWPGGVVYAVLGELREERAAMGWGEEPRGRVAAVRARGAERLEAFCDGMLKQYPAAFHLVAGLTSITGRALSRIVKSTPPEQIAVYSERPGAYGPMAKRVLAHAALPLKYAILVRCFRNRVGLLLPLGKAGLRTFVRYGWPRERAAAFMYCPSMRDGEPSVVPRASSPVRFLYIGRLSRYTKGTDVLLKASERLRGDWQLTLVGGHGDLVDEVRQWADKRDNVTMVGAATPNEVSAEMARHDVCVVPSRFDGWNVVVNESLYAGRGVIVTDQAVSHEMIEASRAGQVVKARSVMDLAAAMQKVIDDPSAAALWHARAEAYVESISPKAVGEYLRKLITGVSESSILGVQAPWIPKDDANGAKRAGQ